MVDPIKQEVRRRSCQLCPLLPMGASERGEREARGEEGGADAEFPFDPAPAAAADAAAFAFTTGCFSRGRSTTAG